MTKEYRLRDRNSFTVLFRRGKRDSAFFKAVFAKNNSGHGRFAFVVSKSVSKSAVSRNTLRRRARERLRKNGYAAGQGLDFVLIFKKEAAGLTRSKFYEELEKILEKVF